MFELIISTAAVLFAAINPIGVASLFAILTRGTDRSHKIAMANRSITVVTIVMLAFAFLGTAILEKMGISFAAFKLAGGLLLLITGINLVMDKGSDPHDDKDLMKKKPSMDIAVFPIAIPMTAGPAALTSIVLYMEQAEGVFMNQVAVIGTTLALLLLVYVLMRSANWVEKVIGQNVINIISRIMGVILSSLALEFVLKGLQDVGIIAANIQLG